MFPWGPQQRAPTQEPREGVTPRAAVIAVVCVLGLSFLMPYGEFIVRGTQIGSYAPPTGPLLTLMLLVALAAAARWGLGRRLLRQSELMAVYFVLLIIAVIPSCQFAQWIIPVITGPFYQATPENGWANHWDLIPRWWGPHPDVSRPELLGTDPQGQIIKAFYDSPKARHALHWAAWWGRVVRAWPYLLGLYLVTICAAVALRRRVRWRNSLIALGHLVAAAYLLLLGISAILRTAASHAVNWAAWWKPIIAWGPFILSLYLTMICISVILRKQWVERERLTFPHVQLPLEILTEGRALMRSRIFWIGAALPIFIHTVNGLHSMFPSVPNVPLHHLSFDRWLVDRPWVMMRPLFVSIYFSLIGFAFLISREVSVSIWFFYLLYKAECAFGASLGWTVAPEVRDLRTTSFPLIAGQQVGAILTVVAIGLWAARPHLREVWRRTLSGERDPEEPISYRTAVIGVAAGVLLCSTWCAFSGMGFGLALILIGLTFLFMIGVHRMMAEGGVNFLWAAQSGPNYLLNAVGGGALISASSWWVMLALPYFVWNFKGPVGPFALEGFKLTEATRLRTRQLVPLAVGGLVVALIASYWSVIYLVHTHGGGVALDFYRYVHVAQRPSHELIAVTTRPEGLSPPKVIAIMLSSVFTFFLAAMRWRFLWWPFHPLGYAVSTIWASNYMWFSMLAGSLLNYLITRAGGLKLYRFARPAFLGMIMGEFLMVGVWLVVCAITGVRGYYMFGD